MSVQAALAHLSQPFPDASREAEDAGGPYRSLGIKWGIKPRGKNKDKLIPIYTGRLLCGSICALIGRAQELLLPKNTSAVGGKAVSH